MKILLFLLSLCTISAFAQDDTSWEVNHYEHTRTFVEDGYTYQCDVDKRSGFVHLYNKENRWTYADQIDDRTGEVYTSNLEDNDVFEMSDETAQTLIDILDKSFSVEEARQISNKGFMVTLFFSPMSGQVVEVCYNFSFFNACAKVPVSYFRDIELKIKERIHVNVLEGGRHLTYLMTCLVHVPTGRP